MALIFPSSPVAGQVYTDPLSGNSWVFNIVSQGWDSFEGVSSTAGTSGTSGTSGVNGTTGAAGTSGTSGTTGAAGTSGTSGTSGASGASGTSGTSGLQGAPGQTLTPLGVLANYAALPPTPGQLDTYILQDTSELYVYDPTSGAADVNGWVNMGQIQGPPGPQGTGGTSGTSGVGTSGTSGTSGPQGPAGTVAFYFQNTVPTGTILVGSLWYHSETGILYVYVNDGDTSQWVEISQGSLTTGGSGSLPTASLRDDELVHKIYDLYRTPDGRPFGWKIGNLTLLTAGFSQAQAQAAFPYFWDRWSRLEETSVVPPNSFRLLTCMTAAIADAIWSGHAGQILNLKEACTSRVNIIIPPGQFLINYQLPLAFGIYSGHGSSEWYTNAGDGSPWGGTYGQGGTSLHVDRASWLGRYDGAIWESTTWGNQDLFSYNENFQLLNMRLVGNKELNYFDVTKMISGVNVWDMGSNAVIDNVYADDFEAACFHFVRGTYSQIRQAAGFRSNLAAIWCHGGGQLTVKSFESDECPAVVRMERGYRRPGNNSIHFNFLKMETGIAPSRPDPKGMLVLDAKGWTKASFDFIQYAAVRQLPHVMFRVDGRGIDFPYSSSNTLGQSSEVTVTHMSIFNNCYGILHDVGNAKMWTHDGTLNLTAGLVNTRIRGFRWRSGNGGEMVTPFGIVPAVVTGMAENRFSPLAVDPNNGLPIGTWNNTAGTPAYVGQGFS